MVHVSGQMAPIVEDSVYGQGADHDTLVASARAYIHALNKLMVKRKKSAPPEVDTQLTA